MIGPTSAYLALSFGQENHAPIRKYERFFKEELSSLPSSLAMPGTGIQLAHGTFSLSAIKCACAHKVCTRIHMASARWILSFHWPC